MQVLDDSKQTEPVIQIGPGIQDSTVVGVSKLNFSSSQYESTNSFTHTWSKPKKPKVIIAIPTRGNVCLELVRWLIETQKKVSLGQTDYEIEIVISKGSPQNPNNNLLAKHCLKNFEFDFYLKIDDDLVPDEDLIPRLLAMNKDIVGVAVAIWRESINGGIFVCCLNRDPKTHLFTPADFVNQRQGKCEYVGGGCFMVKRKVLETMKQPIWKLDLTEEGDFTKGSDERFCDVARELGFEIWYDATKILGQHTDLILTGTFDKTNGSMLVDLSQRGLP